MMINIKSEYTDSNKYVIYKMESGKRKKICKGIFNDSKYLHLNEEVNEKLIMIVYPKYYSKLKWFLVWFLLSFVELYATCFGSFGTDSKMYKEFVIDINTNVSELDLIFNKPRYDLTSSTNGVVINEQIKGKLYAILISILCLGLFILIIFAIVFLQIYFEKNK